MSWFKRFTDGIQTATKFKRETPDGLWFQCPSCKATSTVKELRANYLKCTSCNFHVRIGSHDYFDIIYDDQAYDIHFEELKSYDFLEFEDLKKYKDRLESARKKSSLDEALTVASGKIKGMPLVIAAMDFKFIGGSMGSVVGERIARGIDLAMSTQSAFMIISKSGGARMMESAFSLMQMAKTSVKLSQLAQAKLPYISFLTDPTTGGVTASYAMLGDLNIAEPGALIGFAGPRVIKETIRQELPEGFQKSESVLENGFLDVIIDRSELRDQLAFFISCFTHTEISEDSRITENA